MAAIDAEGRCKSYKGRRGIVDVSFSAGEGVLFLVQGSDVVGVGLLVVCGVGAASLAIAMYRRQDIHA